MDKPDKVQFASAAKIDQVRDIVAQVMKRILGWETWAFVSDASSLFDFPYDELYVSEAEVFAKIRSEFGVDVTDIANGNIAEICERVKLHRLNN